MKSLFLVLVLAFCSVLVQASPETHAQSVRELFKLLDIEKMTETSLQQGVDLLTQQSGQPERRAKIESFLRQVVGYKAIEGDMIRLYQKHFSEAEVQEMVKFYKTPVGKKLARMQPVLFKEGAQIGQNRMMSRQEELQKLLSK